MHKNNDTNLSKTLDDDIPGNTAATCKAGVAVLFSTGAGGPLGFECFCIMDLQLTFLCPLPGFNIHLPLSS